MRIVPLRPLRGLLPALVISALVVTCLPSSADRAPTASPFPATYADPAVPLLQLPTNFRARRTTANLAMTPGTSRLRSSTPAERVACVTCGLCLVRPTSTTCRLRLRWMALPNLRSGCRSARSFLRGTVGLRGLPDRQRRTGELPELHGYQRSHGSKEGLARLESLFDDPVFTRLSHPPQRGFGKERWRHDRLAAVSGQGEADAPPLPRAEKHRTAGQADGAVPHCGDRGCRIPRRLHHGMAAAGSHRHGVS